MKAPTDGPPWGHVTLELFLREVQPFAWKTADSLGHNYLDFMDQRNMAARRCGFGMGGS